MEPSTNAILESAMLLSESERIALVSRLLESVSTDTIMLSVDDPELMNELERRFADREGGVPWSDLRAEG